MNDEIGAANDEIKTLNDEIAQPNEEITAVNDEIMRRMVDSKDARQGKALLQNSLQERFS
jgi:predicted  nucleic acid-binding Zn-ribbon protein